MITTRSQYITDQMGEKKSIILPIKDYNRMLETLEELEDICLYDKAKQEDDGEYILFSKYLTERKKNA